MAVPRCKLTLLTLYRTEREWHIFHAVFGPGLSNAVTPEVELTRITLFRYASISRSMNSCVEP